MTRSLALAAATWGLLAAAAFGQANLGGPLDGLARFRDFEAARSSSNDPDWRNGNWDARGIRPGGTLTIAELEGPGEIAHIWCTIAHGLTGYSRQLTLRMYWDGEEHPSVECPIGDFFVIGHGVDKPFESLPVTVSSEGRARNCYWPMPFRKSAVITVTNDSDVQCDAFFWYVDWRKLESLPADTAYFHAMYRQEFPCVMGRNYLLADIEGRGHYVGTVQSVYHTSGGWFGEGDDFWFIDGEDEPSLRGTGTEDYFCDAWGFREFDGPFYGVPLWEGFETGSRATAYRFHLTDPVPFRKSLRVEIEHKGSQVFPDGSVTGFIERDDLMSSVAFWYQDEPHKPWPAPPPGPDRMPFVSRALFEAESAVETASHSEAPLTTQDLPAASGGKQLFFNPSAEDAWLEASFELPEAVEGLVILRLFHSWDYGRYAVSLDGTPLGEWDLYDESVTPEDHSIGMRRLEAGRHTLRFECTGKNGDSPGYFLGIDALTLVEPVYKRLPSEDLRALQVEPRERPAYLTDRQIERGL